MRVCPVCGSPVMTWIEVSAEQDEEGYWHPITEYKGTTVSQQDIDTSCEADGNYCACTNPHCGIPRIDGERLIPPIIYDKCVDNYIPAWIELSNKMPSEKEALLRKYHTRESLPDALREEYDAWYARLIWSPWTGAMWQTKIV